MVVGRASQSTGGTRGHAREDRLRHRLCQELATPGVAATNERNDRPLYGRDMAGSMREGAEMQRRMRFTIKLIALGCAVAAMAAPSAQARLDPGEGVGGTNIVSSANRPHGVSSSKSSFDFGAWSRRHWRNIPE